MPLQVTLVKEHDKALSSWHLMRGLRIPDDIRVNKVVYVDSRDPEVPVETLANRLHIDNARTKNVLTTSSPPTKVMGKNEYEEVLMDEKLPHVYTDSESPYKLEAKVILMNEDLQILACV